MRKYFIIGLIVLFMIEDKSLAGDLRKVEVMTHDEILELKEAKEDLSKAEKKLKDVRLKIIDAHGMKEERYMEWETYVEINGEYILNYYRSHMPQSSILYDAFSHVESDKKLNLNSLEDNTDTGQQ